MVKEIMQHNRRGQAEEFSYCLRYIVFQLEFDSLVFLFLEDCNQVRPYSAENYRTPASEAILSAIVT
jgi:hypothetical protein